MLLAIEEYLLSALIGPKHRDEKCVGLITSYMREYKTSEGRALDLGAAHKLYLFDMLMTTPSQAEFRIILDSYHIDCRASEIYMMLMDTLHALYHDTKIVSNSGDRYSARSLFLHGSLSSERVILDGEIKPAIECRLTSLRQALKVGADEEERAAEEERETKRKEKDAKKKSKKGKGKEEEIEEEEIEEIVLYKGGDRWQTNIFYERSSPFAPPREMSRLTHHRANLMIGLLEKIDASLVDKRTKTIPECESVIIARILLHTANPPIKDSKIIDKLYDLPSKEARYAFVDGLYQFHIAAFPQGITADNVFRMLDQAVHSPASVKPMVEAIVPRGSRSCVIL